MIRDLKRIRSSQFCGRGSPEVESPGYVAAIRILSTYARVCACDPEVGAAGVDLDGEGLGRRADCDVDVVAGRMLACFGGRVGEWRASETGAGWETRAEAAGKRVGEKTLRV